MLSDTLQTLVSIPFYALTPEITLDYDERTSLTGYRMFFNLLASLATAVAAPAIVDAALAGGATQQQGYFIVSALFGGLATIPFLLIFAVVRERDNVADAAEPEIPFLETVRTAWKNVPFRFATGLYMLNWITFDLVALVLPFFLAYWVAKGNLLQKALGLPLDSAVFACLLVTSVIVLPFWVWLARISVSTAHVLPDAIFPDVIEWDELHTGHRREGIYYGVKNFVRKMTGALAIFIALQTLGWFGYQSPPAGATQFSQPASALQAIRFLIGPMGALLLFGAVTMAWFYPLTRERHARIRALLERKKERAIAKEAEVA